jgi:peptidoglycan/LPS O-acetylase OafA/YrhL
LGDWSYALYLIHVPVFAALGRIAAPFSRPGPLDNLVLLTVALAAAIITAWVLHVGFDKPIQRVAASLRGRRAAGG